MIQCKHSSTEFECSYEVRFLHLMKILFLLLQIKNTIMAAASSNRHIRQK